MSGSVTIKTLSGSSFEVDYRLDQTVAALKEAIQAKTNTPPERQRLLFHGRVLDPTLVLSQQGITAGCVLHMVEKEPGAPDEPEGQAAAADNDHNEAGQGQQQPLPFPTFVTQFLPPELVNQLQFLQAQVGGAAASPATTFNPPFQHKGAHGHGHSHGHGPPNIGAMYVGPAPAAAPPPARPASNPAGQRSRNTASIADVVRSRLNRARQLSRHLVAVPAPQLIFDVVHPDASPAQLREQATRLLDPTASPGGVPAHTVRTARHIHQVAICTDRIIPALHELSHLWWQVPIGQEYNSQRHYLLRAANTLQSCADICGLLASIEPEPPGAVWHMAEAEARPLPMQAPGNVAVQADEDMSQIFQLELQASMLNAELARLQNDVNTSAIRQAEEMALFSRVDLTVEARAAIDARIQALRQLQQSSMSAMAVVDAKRDEYFSTAQHLRNVIRQRTIARDMQQRQEQQRQPQQPPQQPSQQQSQQPPRQPSVTPTAAPTPTPAAPTPTPAAPTPTPAAPTSTPTPAPATQEPPQPPPQPQQQQQQRLRPFSATEWPMVVDSIERAAESIGAAPAPDALRRAIQQSALPQVYGSLVWDS